MKFFHFCSCYNIGIQHTKYYGNPCVGRSGTPPLCLLISSLTDLALNMHVESLSMPRDVNMRSQSLT